MISQSLHPPDIRKVSDTFSYTFLSFQVLVRMPCFSALFMYMHVILTVITPVIKYI